MKQNPGNFWKDEKGYIYIYIYWSCRIGKLDLCYAAHGTVTINLS